MSKSVGCSIPRDLGLRISRCFLIAAAAGLVWRLVRFALHFEMTGDESNILRSVMERDYAGLLKPLDYAAVSPPGFLWLTKFMDSVFPCDWGARLMPFLAGFAATAMFWLICREALRGTARWAAWAVFCVSYVPVTEGTRSKGYSMDLLLAAVMLWWILRWLRERDNVRYLAWLTLCAPVAVWLSYTSVFIIGAAGLIWAASLLKGRLGPERALEPGYRAVWPAVWLWLAFVTLAGVSAILLYKTNIRSALQTSRAVNLDDFWGGGFPPTKQPWQIPLWLLTVHTGRGFAWPVGGDHFASTLTFVLWLTGLVVYWRRGNRWVWWLFVTAQVLSLTAAFFHKYPYLTNPRISIFLGPGICLFVGVGIQYLIDRRRAETRRGWHRFAAFVFLLCAIGGIARDLALRVREFKGPGIRSVLVDASRRLGPNGQFVLLNAAGTSAVFTYYISRSVGQKVCWNGEAPQQTAPGLKLALVAVGSNITQKDYNALLQGFRERFGRPVKITWSEVAHEVLLDNKDEMIVWVCE